MRAAARRRRAVASATALAALVGLTACSAPRPPGPAPTPGALTIGTLVPLTGAMSAFGPAEKAGIALAVKDVGDAGGVLGQPVQVVEGDSGDPFTAVASQSVDRELAQKVSAVVGATGSSVTLTVIDKIVGAGAAEVSPGDASTKLTGYPDRGLYARLAPPDTAAAQVLSDTIRRAGHRSIAVVAVRDAYGSGFQAELEADFRRAGGRVVASIQYDGTSKDLGAIAGQISVPAADANVLIGFSETRAILDGLVALHAGPDVIPLYVSDLALTGSLTAGLAQSAAAGVVGVRPGAAPPATFVARLMQASPDLTDIGYAAQAYDSVVLVALAAQASGSTTGRSIAAALPGLTTGSTPCATYRDCVAALKAGRSVAYVGMSGVARLDAAGEPTSATIGVFRYARPGKVPDAAAAYTTLRVPPATA